MGEWKNIGNGLIELENGVPTGRTHPHTYHEAHGHIMRVKHNADGSTVAEMIQPRIFVLSDPRTGDLVGVHEGFILAAELGSLKPVTGKTKDGVETDCMEVSSLPADFNLDTYKVYNNKIIKK